MQIGQIILLAAGTIITILFFAKMHKGKQYQNLIDPLDEDAFPLKNLYAVGFGWADGKMLKFEGDKPASLKRQAALVYDRRYSDYYARVIWAEAITMIHMMLCFALLLAGLMYTHAFIFLIGGVGLAIFMGVYVMDSMKTDLDKRREECDAVLPEVASTMAVLVNSGMMLHEAWVTVSTSNEGTFYDLMQKSVANMQNGYSDSDAIKEFGRETDSNEVKKFTSALVSNIEKGGGDIGLFLANQSSELWDIKRQKMLQLGEVAATKLLLPIVMIFGGIILIVMTAAFAGTLF